VKFRKSEKVPSSAVAVLELTGTSTLRLKGNASRTINNDLKEAIRNLYFICQNLELLSNLALLSHLGYFTFMYT
jgi:hypothetical protein